MNTHNLIYWYSLLAFGLAAIFVYQGIINLLIHRQRVLLYENTFYLISLSFLSAGYSFGTFYLLQDHDPTFNLHVLMANWVMGSLINFSYIKAMQAFLNLRSKLLDIIAFLPLISALGGLLAEVLYVTTDINLILDSSAPIVPFNNIFMARVGGFNPHLFIKVLSLFLVIPSILALGIFLRFMLPRRVEFLFLILGVICSLVVIILDGTTAIYDGRFRYLPPLLFLSNLIEILRITYVNQLSFGKRISELQNDLIQSHKLAEAGDYFAKLSHEIANPLYAARSYFELLFAKINQDDFTPKMRKYQANIMEQFSHIQALINNVKDLTRPTQTRTFELASINSVIETTIEMTKIKAYHAGLNVEFQKGEDSLVLCHRDQIVQVLCNLVNNGIEAIPTQPGWVKIVLTKKPELLEISVIDSGPGIPPAIRDQIFDTRFTTKREKGNGLGLSICRTIMENHHGKIYLNASSPNTEFVLGLPIS